MSLKSFVCCFCVSGQLGFFHTMRLNIWEHRAPEKTLVSNKLVLFEETLIEVLGATRLCLYGIQSLSLSSEITLFESRILGAVHFSSSRSEEILISWFQ